MPTRDNTIMYAMYVIGKVESDWDWAAVYRADPITIGMMQEYGQNASDLLKLCRDGDADGWASFAASAPDLVADVDAHGDSWDWWTSRYITDSEASAWQAMAARPENHKIQQDKWKDEAARYIDTLTGWGWSEERPQTLVYAMCIYHQSPQACGQVTRSCSGSATLDNLHATTLNHWIGKYANRYNQAYDMLNDWDGESAPPDFGQVVDSPGGGDSGTVSQPSNDIDRVEMRNGQIVVWGLSSYPNGLICTHAAPNIWIPWSRKGGTDNPGGTTGGGTAQGAEAAEKAAELMRGWEKRFSYSQGAGRLSPESSGYTDCSGVIWYAYQQAASLDVGTWTGEQAENGRQIAWGNNGMPYNAETLYGMRTGDLVLIDWNTVTSPGNTSYDHVEMYMGDNKLMGHGGGTAHPMGPYWKDDMLAYMRNVATWEIRRYAE